MVFQNREHAGTLLAEKLTHLGSEAPLVLAVPRGGVPMAREIARRLNADLDVVLVRKVGAPLDPEYTIGSIGESGVLHLDPSSNYMDVPDRYLAEQMDRRMMALRELRARYSPYRTIIPCEGRTVIIVDDGLFSGADVLFAVREIRGRQPKRIVVATAVAASEILSRISSVADEVVVLEEPAEFFAVSQFFEDFPDVSDDEVTALLRDHLKAHRPHYAPGRLTSPAGDEHPGGPPGQAGRAVGF